MSETSEGYHGDPIGELARRRRDEAIEDASAPQPDFVEGVEQSEVKYYFDPIAVPLAYVDVALLRSELKKQYGVSLSPLDRSPLPRAVSMTPEEEEELVSKLKRAGDLVLEFKSGKFPIRNDYVPIRTIRVNYESIFVAVGGVSQVAEVIVTEVMTLLWEFAGAKKEWSSIEGSVQAITYATGTRIQLPFPLENLLNSRFTGYLLDNLTTNAALAERMGTIQKRQSLTPPNYSAVFHADQLSFIVSLFNHASGDAEQNTLRFLVTGRSDYGSGRILVQSEMNYDDHVSMVSGLISSLT